jgi:hypothetical protein
MCDWKLRRNQESFVCPETSLPIGQQSARKELFLVVIGVCSTAKVGGPLDGEGRWSATQGVPHPTRGFSPCAPGGPKSISGPSANSSSALPPGGTIKN